MCALHYARDHASRCRQPKSELACRLAATSYFGAHEQMNSGRGRRRAVTRVVVGGHLSLGRPSRATQRTGDPSAPVRERATASQEFDPLSLISRLSCAEGLPSPRIASANLPPPGAALLHWPRVRIQMASLGSSARLCAAASEVGSSRPKLRLSNLHGRRSQSRARSALASERLDAGLGRAYRPARRRSPDWPISRL